MFVGGVVDGGACVCFVFFGVSEFEFVVCFLKCVFGCDVVVV